MTFPEQIIQALADHKAGAAQALKLFREHCEGTKLPRVPGCDTIIRLAWRIQCGRTIEEAAAREYLYRWNLALRGWDAPHALGL